jgi:hypothetical protein
MMYCLHSVKPAPLAARSKAYVCGRSPADIMISNPTGGMDVCLLLVMCVFRWSSLRRLITRTEESYRLWYGRCV